MIGLFKAIES